MQTLGLRPDASLSLLDLHSSPSGRAIRPDISLKRPLFGSEQGLTRSNSPSWHGVLLRTVLAGPTWA